MKLGILGTGMIVKDLLKTIDEIHIDAISILGTQQTKDETQQLVKQYQLDQAFYDYDMMLKSDIDTVYVALPNHLHYSFSKKAIEAGKHVIIEKPITSNVKELQDLIEIADEKNLMIFEAMNIHYLPAYRSLKENLSKVGKVKVVNFNYSQYSSRYDAFKEGNILPAFDYHKSGGALMDIHVYNIHAIMGLFQTPINNYYFANVEKNIDTSGMMVYDYGMFKAVSIGAKDCQAPVVSTIQGDQGVIVIHKPVNQMMKYSYIDNNAQQIDYDFNEGKHRLFYEFMEFKRMIDEKDYQGQQEMLSLSLEISKVMEKARQQQNIIFDADK